MSNSGANFESISGAGEKLSKLAIHASITSAATLTANELTPVNATSGAITVTLPTGKTFGTLIAVEKEDATENVVTVTGSIRGEAATDSLKLKRETVLYQAESSGSWRPLADHKTLSSLDARYEAKIAETISGLVGHENVYLATAEVLPTNTYLSGVLTGTALGALTVDGVAATVGKRLIIKNEINQANNGIYTVTHAGGVAEAYVLTRATDMNSGAGVEKAYAFTEAGTKNKNSGWFVSAPGPFTIGTTAIPWSKLPGTGDLVAGEGINIVGDVIAVSPSVVSDSRGSAAGDILLFNGTGFVRLPKGETGQQMIVCADGTIRYENPAAISLDAWVLGASGNITSKLEEALEAAKTKGVFVKAGAKTYIVDGWVLKAGNKIEGAGTQTNNATIFQAESGSSNGSQVSLAEGRVLSTVVRDIYFKPNGNAGQHCFHLQGVEKSGEAQFANCLFENVHIGSSGIASAEAWSGHGMWLDFGTTGSNAAENIDFRNVQFSRANEGAGATTARCLKCTGQVEKLRFDRSCYFQGGTENVRVGTLIEFGLQQTGTTTITAEAKAGATTITVASTAGLTEAGTKFSIGEGAFNEIHTVESVSGLKITLTTALENTHASTENIYILAGFRYSSIIGFEGSTLQWADLGVLCSSSGPITFSGCDCEYLNRVARVREQSDSVSFPGLRLIESGTEGKSQGTGVVTVGSTSVTSVSSTAWVNGDVINGYGIPAGTTVASGGGTATLTLSNPVTANGAENGQAIQLVKGGEGKGYVVKYETGSTGEADWFTESAIDKGIVNVGSGAGRYRGIPISSQVLNTGGGTQVSSKITLALATAETLNVRTAAEVVLTNATTAIKSLLGQHGTGQSVTLRATVAGTKLESGGNLYIPAGSIELGVGECAVFMRTDFGPLTWVYVATPPPAVTASRIARWMASMNSTTASQLGLALSAQGTATARTFASTGLYTRLARLGYIGATTANANAGVIGTQQFNGTDGYTATIVFGIQAYNAGHQYAVGVASSYVATKKPSEMTAAIIMCADPGDTTWKIRAGSAEMMAPVELGANFPVNTSETDLYELTIEVAPGASVGKYKVVRLNTGATASGALSKVPTSTTSVGIDCVGSNLATGAAVSLDLSQVTAVTPH